MLRKLSTPKSLKHEAVINETLEYLFKRAEEPWTNEEDKAEMKKLVLSQMASSGLTMEKMDEQIEEGIRNGYTARQQIAIMCEFII